MKLLNALDQLYQHRKEQKMGQAKQRGSKEQRAAQAIERNTLAHQENLKMRELERVASIERAANMAPQERLRKERTKRDVIFLTSLLSMASGLPCTKTPEITAQDNFIVGGKYNWINQSERLIYLGHNFSGNGFWHQFAKVESPETIWCEVVNADLDKLEPTTERTAA
jgi:hypothetical protein